MTERANKDKLRRSLSLSKNKKKSSVKAGISASAATTSAPITSFFSSQPPPKLACPLCGQLVPRFKINEHIDLQCQNFERGDSSAASASNSVVPSSIQLSPRRNPTKSPELDPKRVEEVKESKTSPYFKKNNSQQAPREIKSKSVVRTIDLGSLASKLSRKRHKVPERTQAEDKHALVCPEKETYSSETLSSSQKENLLIQNDKKDCVTVIDLTETSEDTPTASDKGLNHEHKASKSKTVEKVVTPKLRSSSSKLGKRKKGTTSTGRVFNLRKKSKYEGSSRELEEVLSSENVAETTDTDQLKTEVPSTTCDPPLSSEETHEKTSAAISSDSQAESGAETTTSDQAAESSHPPRLPYYLCNFRTVLQAVLENEDDRSLFNQDDMSLIHAFEKLSGMLTYIPQSLLF